MALLSLDGRGGGGFTLGPPQNVFTGATRSAAETSRDTYFTANPSNLATYNSDTSLNIRLEYSVGGNQEALFQVRNAAGDAWLDNSSSVGVPGAPGAPGADAAINLADGEIGVASSGQLVASSLTESSERLESTKPIDLPDASMRIGGTTLSNVGFGVQTQTADGRDFLPTSYELTANGSEDTVKAQMSGVRALPSPANQSETFTGNQVQAKFVVVSSALINSAIYRQAVGSSAVTDCNIIYRFNSHTDTGPALYDYKRATGGVGFTMEAGGTDTVINFPGPGLFVEQGTIVYITIIADSGDTLNILGQTLTQDGTSETIPFAQGSGRLIFPRALLEAFPPLPINTDLAMSSTTWPTYRNRTVVANNSSGVRAVSIASGAAMPGETLTIKHDSSGTGTATFTPTGSTVDGSASDTIANGEAVTYVLGVTGTWIRRDNFSIGGGTADGVADAFSNSISGQDVTLTIGRSGSLSDLTTTFTVPGGGGSALTIEDEGTALTTAATTLNFTGTGVTATGSGTEKTINIPGGLTQTQVDARVEAYTGQSATTDPIPGAVIGGSYTSGAATRVLANTVGADAQWVNVSTLQTGVTVEDEGSALTTAATTLDFVGNLVTASGTGAEKTITISDSTAPTRTELTYVNTQADNTVANFSTTGSNSGAYATQQTLAIPSFTGSRYVVIAQPSDEPDLTLLLIGGLDQLGTFTKSGTTAQVGGVTYEFWYSNNTLLGTTVSGTSMTINRG